MRFRHILRKILEPNLVWSTAVYVQQQPFQPGATLSSPWKVFDAKLIDLFGRYPHTYADPFLFVHAGALYIFLEVVQKGRHGEIAAYRTSDLQEIEELGIVFTMPFHVSFPFVFEEAPSIYMIPESSKDSSVTLYQFSNFPFDLRKVRTLLNGNFVDSHLLKRNGMWFLFTTCNDILQLYVADDLFHGDFRPHPASPISANTKVSRSAGSLLNLGGRLYRVAQDCSSAYGRNASLVEIQVLSPAAYQESVIVDQLFALDNSWDEYGAHHLTVCDFLGKTIIATDGKQRDFFINRLLSFGRTLMSTR